MGIKQFQKVTGVKAMQRKMHTQLSLLKKGGRATSLWFWGAMGIGKTQGIQEFAEQEDIALRVIPCSSISEGEIGGMPILEKDKDGTSHLTKKMIKEFLPMPGEKDYERPGLLFLDELGNCKKEIRTELLTLTDGTKRKYGYTMPKQWLVVVASNTEEQGGLEQGEFSANMQVRFANFAIEPDTKEWLNWASSQIDPITGSAGLNPLVLAFLKLKADMLIEDDNQMRATLETQNTTANPRKWENIAHEISLYEDDNIFDLERPELEQDIIAQLGKRVGSEFIKFIDLKSKMIDSELIYSYNVNSKNAKAKKEITQLANALKEADHQSKLISFDMAINKLSKDINEAKGKNKDELKVAGVVNIIENLSYGFKSVPDYITTFCMQIKHNKVLGDAIGSKLNGKFSGDVEDVINKVWELENK